MPAIEIGERIERHPRAAKVPVSFSLDRDQVDWIERVASEQRMNRSAVIRDLIRIVMVNDTEAHEVPA